MFYSLLYVSVSMNTFSISQRVFFFLLFCENIKIKKKHQYCFMVNTLKIIKSNWIYIFLYYIKFNNSMLSMCIISLQIRTCFRFVDKTLILFRSFNRQTENMINCLNNINKHILFKLVTQISNKFNFLELK